MALQHFYSRIPARMSMYEKIDSFDTFAKSEMITKQYINDNLIGFCNAKLSPNELSMIRDGLFSPSYAQYTSRVDNNFIQCAVTYLPLDFTGERSSYFAHSLIFSEEEKNLICSSNENCLLNPSLFKTSIDEFSITSKDAKPLEKYEEKPLSFRQYKDPFFLTTEFNEKTFKRLIFAILQTASPKGKPVYISFDKDIKELSNYSLEFINSLSSVLPYYVRKRLSFMTFTCDINRNSNIIKIKFMPKEFFNIPQSKGYKFDMNPSTIDGIRDEEYKLYENVIEHLYDLLSNKSLRDKFNSFIDNIVNNNPKIKTFDLKDFSNMIFLFRQSSPEYPDSIVIPTDKDIFDLLCIYESYRDYLKENDRCEILKCIKKYPEKRLMIPQNIFSRITKIYPTELVTCKTTIMEKILELIHTDVMRDKLFNFIKNNYSEEIQENRSIISEDLSKVFYGGFLQNQIIGLYSQYYGEEVLETKTVILEKLLLAIRTPVIQDKILEFINKYYDIFTQNQKNMIYKSLFEMLIENDSLSKKIISFTDANFDKDEPSFKNKIITDLMRCIENDEKRSTRHLALMVIQNRGKLEGIVINKIFTVWSSRGILLRYLDSFNDDSLINVCEKIIKVFTNSFSMTIQTEKKLLNKVLERLQSINNNNLYEIIDFDESLKIITSDSFFNANSITKLENKELINFFYKDVKTKFIIPNISDKLLDCLNINLKDNGLDYITHYIKENDYLIQSENYHYVAIIIDTIECINNNQYKDAIYRVINASLNKDIMKIMHKYLQVVLEDIENIGYNNDTYAQNSVAFSLLKTYLDNGKLNLLEAFNYSFNKKKKILTLKDLFKNNLNVDSLSSIWTLKQILNLITIFYDMNNEVSKRDLLYNDNETFIRTMIKTSLKLLDKDGNKKLITILDNIKTNELLYNYVYQIVDEYNRDNKKSFFSKLFGKK